MLRLGLFFRDLLTRPAEPDTGVGSAQPLLPVRVSHNKSFAAEVMYPRESRTAKCCLKTSSRRYYVWANSARARVPVPTETQGAVAFWSLRFPQTVKKREQRQTEQRTHKRTDQSARFNIRFGTRQQKTADED